MNTEFHKMRLICELSNYEHPRTALHAVSFVDNPLVGLLSNIFQISTPFTQCIFISNISTSQHIYV